MTLWIPTARKRPYMFTGPCLAPWSASWVLIDHYAAPTPVAGPVQARIIPIADRHVPMPTRCWPGSRPPAAGRGDDGSDRMNAKIRNGQMQRIPYLLVVGDREAEDGAVAVRLRTNENLGAMSVDDFLARAQKLVAERNNTDL